MAAAMHPAWAQGSTRFDGQYVGELVLTSTVKGDCTQPPLGSTYPLTISRGEVKFKYTPRFDTALVGTIRDSGAFEASARTRGGLIRMTGRVDRYGVTASIASPSCNYSFQARE